jgi:hypothetical protein
VIERDVLKGDCTADFVTDAYATIAVAYHRAAGNTLFDTECRSCGCSPYHNSNVAP